METEEFKTEGRNRKQIMVDLNAKISIMTLNVNGLNTSMRRRRKNGLRGLSSFQMSNRNCNHK